METIAAYLGAPGSIYCPASTPATPGNNHIGR